MMSTAQRLRRRRGVHQVTLLQYNKKKLARTTSTIPHGQPTIQPSNQPTNHPTDNTPGHQNAPTNQPTNQPTMPTIRIMQPCQPCQPSKSSNHANHANQHTRPSNRTNHANQPTRPSKRTKVVGVLGESHAVAVAGPGFDPDLVEDERFHHPRHLPRLQRRMLIITGTETETEMD